jgi:hypothetical protein
MTPGMDPDQPGIPKFGNLDPDKIILPFDIGRTRWRNTGDGYKGFILFISKIFPLYGKELPHHPYPGIDGPDLRYFFFTGKYQREAY